MALIDGFFGWEDLDGGFVPFPIAFTSLVTSMGATPLITWQPAQAAANGGPPAPNQAGFTDAVLATAAYDPFLKTWADAARTFGQPLYVRLMHEPNDDQYPWAYGVNDAGPSATGNTAAQYVAAFQHIVSIFQAEGATNVQFIWCVGAESYGRNPVPLSELFPGDDNVAWISLDGYNRNKSAAGGYESFASVFQTAYSDITAFSSRPVLIAETATENDPDGGDLKAQWITDAFLSAIPNQFPRIRAALYFNSGGSLNSMGVPNNTWPLTLPQDLASFQQVAGSFLYQSSAPAQTWLYPDAGN